MLIVLRSEIKVLGGSALLWTLALSSFDIVPASGSFAHIGFRGKEAYVILGKGTCRVPRFLDIFFNYVFLPLLKPNLVFIFQALVVVFKPAEYS